MSAGTGMYVAGDSPIHRLPAGLKLTVLIILGALSPLVSDPVGVSALLLVTAAALILTRIRPALLLRQLRAPLVMVTLLAGYHLVLHDAGRAYVVAGRLLAVILAAVVVTITTRTMDLVDAVVVGLAPLRVVGVDPERVGLTLSLGIRSVPVIVTLAAEVRQAQLARGLGASPLAYGVPLLVRSIRRADQLADALVARGMD